MMDSEINGIVLFMPLTPAVSDVPTDGRTTDGSAIPSLVGMPKDYMVLQLKAFKDGTRPATVMHQITKGLTDAQIDTIATYYAATKR